MQAARSRLGRARAGCIRGRLAARPRSPRMNKFPIHNQENQMALVSMRQLLDHAAENGYGVPAFNVNNLEQVQAIMEAANEVNAPVIMQASAGARKYAGETFLKHLIEAAVESYPQIAGRDAPGPWPVAGGVRRRDQSRLLVGDDGRLAARGRQDASPTMTTTGRSPRKSSTWRTPSASASRVNWVALGHSRR